MFKVQCDRCKETADVEWANIDTGYWVTPKTWLKTNSNLHLCPECYKRALEPTKEWSK